MVKLFNVKDDNDFIFKLSLLITSLVFVYFIFYLIQNYYYLFPVIEGLENNEEEESNNENEDKDGGDSKNINTQYSNTKEILLKKVNNEFSSDNRDKTVDRISWYRNYNKAKLLETILSSTKEETSKYFNEISTRLKIEDAYNDGKIDNIISTFPLTESEQSSDSSSSSSSSSYGIF